MSLPAKPSASSEFDDYGIPAEITTRDGVKVRTAESKWVVDLNSVIHWKALSGLPVALVLAIRSYICHVLQTSAARSAKTTFWRLQAGLYRIDHEKLAAMVRKEIGLDLFFAFKSALENDSEISPGTAREMQSSFRRWYIWCSDVELPGFSEDVALELEGRVIGGSAKGLVVLSNDPDIGPLGLVDDTRLEAAIATDYSELRQLSTPDLQALIAVMLSKSFGLYAAHLQLIDEADIQTERLSDESEIHWLETPRLKKRGMRAKVGSRKRRISDRLAECIEVLRYRNAKEAALSVETGPVASARSLFVRKIAREEFSGTKLERDALRWSLQSFIKAISAFCVRHELGFRVTPRRLRYTFATRLVDEGCSPLELADALDHTDLQHVMVYFNSRGRIVRQLDEAMAVRLAPFARAFVGRAVASAKDATRGDDPLSVIRFKAPDRASDEVGSCGSFRSCGLNAPIACYTCVRFEPWLSAPHEIVLSELVRDRRRREEKGLDEKMIQIHDATILAVADVVSRIQLARESLGEDAA